MGNLVNKEEIIEQVLQESTQGKISTLHNVIRSGDEDLSREIVLELLKYRKGIDSLVGFFRGEEGVLVDTVALLDDDKQGVLIESVLYELSSIVNDSEYISPKMKIKTMKETISSIINFFVSLSEKYSTEEFLNILDILGGEELLHFILSEVNIEVYNENGLDGFSQIEEGYDIYPDIVEYSGKYSEPITELMENLYEIDYNLYVKLLEEKLKQQNKLELFENEKFKSEEFGLEEVTLIEETVYIMIKTKIEEYKKKNQDRDFTPHKTDSYNSGLLLGYKNQEGKKIKTNGQNKIEKIAEEVEKDEYDLF